MSIAISQLLIKKRFWPIFICQFIQALNDNIYKLGMLTLISFQITSSAEASSYYQSVGAALFILPFIIFSSLAGELSDKYNKVSLIKIIKFVEIILMMIGSLALWQHHISLMMLILFGMGTHSAFFGPLKYAILPEHLKHDELITGNALIEGSTFIAILCGTIIGTACTGNELHLKQGLTLLSILLISLSSLAFITSFKIPKTKLDLKHTHKISFNLFKSSWLLSKKTLTNSSLNGAVLAISWFWLLGGIVLAELPSLVKYSLHGSSSILSLLLALFSIGVAMGSIVIEKFLKGAISQKYFKFGLIGMSIGLLDLALASASFSNMHLGLLNLNNLFASSHALRCCFDVFLISFCGGVMTVPLYAALQANSKTHQRARTIAANNIINSLFMIVGSLSLMGLTRLGAHSPSKFCYFSIANLLALLVLKRPVNRL